MTTNGESARLARTACLPCRRSKRRCDRNLPACDLCLRKEVECDYPARRETSHGLGAASGPGGMTPVTSPPDSQLNERMRDDASYSQPYQPPSYSASPNPSAVAFLAPRLFQQARLELPKLDVPIPSDVSLTTGDLASMRCIASEFFKNIHWLPIIYRQDFFTTLLNPLAQRRTELSLLTLCMKLSCSTPTDRDQGEESSTAIYRSAKRFYSDVEASSVLSVRVLQAGILIAMYEIGHAIYPAAYLSVGACARYGLALGIDKLGLKLMGDGDGPRIWHEVEEKRRVWWAVLIFDRFLNVTNPLRSLSTEDPSFETYLPVDDDAWDDGTTRSSDAVNIRTGFTLKMGRFARLAQSTFLFSQVLRSFQPAAPERAAALYDETRQLRRTLLALVHTTDMEAQTRQLEFCAQSALSFSGILLLQAHHFKNDSIGNATLSEEEHAVLLNEALWDETRTALDRLTGAAASYNVTCVTNRFASNLVSCFLIHAMYQVASTLLRLTRGAPDEETAEKIGTLRELLNLMDSRWRLAGKSTHAMLINFNTQANKFPRSVSENP
ncbi:hypothetical protein GQ53DRAFT_872412 [Thozetella sp. PMI_491]|nr:hypothetical protein GQ53DRAFT_872412 [Thozetella sp. PMI_491]